MGDAHIGRTVHDLTHLVGHVVKFTDHHAPPLLVQAGQFLDFQGLAAPFNLGHVVVLAVVFEAVGGVGRTQLLERGHEAFRRRGRRLSCPLGGAHAAADRRARRERSRRGGGSARRGPFRTLPNAHFRQTLERFLVEIAAQDGVFGLADEVKVHPEDVGRLLDPLPEVRLREFRGHFARMEAVEIKAVEFRFVRVVDEGLHVFDDLADEFFFLLDRLLHVDFEAPLAALHAFGDGLDEDAEVEPFFRPHAAQAVRRGRDHARGGHADEQHARLVRLHRPVELDPEVRRGVGLGAHGVMYVLLWQRGDRRPRVMHLGFRARRGRRTATGHRVVDHWENDDKTKHEEQVRQDKVR